MSYFDRLDDSQKAEAVAAVVEFSQAFGSKSRLPLKAFASRKEEEAKKIWKKQQLDPGNGGVNFNDCKIGALGDGAIGVGHGGDIQVGAASSEKKRVAEQEEPDLQDEEERKPRGKRCKSDGGALGVPTQNPCGLLNDLISLIDPHYRDRASRKVEFSPETKFVAKNRKKSKVTSLQERLIATDDLGVAKSIGHRALDENRYLREERARFLKDQLESDTEVARLRAERNHARTENHRLRRERNEARAENNRLRRERNEARDEVDRLGRR